jgi:hypothetical protein
MRTVARYIASRDSVDLASRSLLQCPNIISQVILLANQDGTIEVNDEDEMADDDSMDEDF